MSCALVSNSFFQAAPWRIDLLYFSPQLLELYIVHLGLDILKNGKY